MSEIQDQLQLKPVQIEIKQQEEPQNLFADQQKRKEENDRLQEQKNQTLLSSQKNQQEDPKQDQKQDSQAKLNDILTRVGQSMPPVYPNPGQVVQDEKKAVYKTGKQQLPSSFRRILDEIMLWQEVKEESSAPVQRAATALREAETDEAAAAAMGDLMAASLDYLKMRSGFRVRGWGRERQRLVKKTLDAIQSFVSSGRSVYAKSLGDTMTAHTDRRRGLPENYREYRERLNNGIRQKTGHNDLGGFANARAQQEAQTQALRKEGIELVDIAADRIAQRNTPASLRKKCQIRKERSMTTEQVRQWVNTVTIPDVSLINDEDLFEDASLETMRAEVLEPLQEVLDHEIAFGHITDIDEIHRLRARVDTLREELDLYDLRLSVLSGDEKAFKEYKKKASLGKSIDEIEADKLAGIQREAREKLGESVRLLAVLDGRSLSKDQKKERALIIEQRIAKRSYFNNAQAGVEAGKNVRTSLFLPADNQVQLEREIALMCGLVAPEFIVRKETETENGKVTEFVSEKWTDEKFRNLLTDAASSDPEAKLRANRMMVDNILHMDVSVFDKTDTDEDIFSNFYEKISILQIFSQLKAFASYIEKSQAELDRDKYRGQMITASEINKIRVLGEFGETINATIGFTQDSLKKKGSELVTYEDIMSIRSKERREIFLDNGLGVDDGLTEEEEELNQITGSYSQAAPELLDYKAGCSTKFLREDGEFKSHYPGITVILNKTALPDAYRNLQKKEYNWDKITDNKYKGAANTIENKKKDLDSLLNRVKGVNRERISNLDRNNVQLIYYYWNANQACEEAEKFAQKHGIALSQEDQQAISDFREFYNKTHEYLELYGELLLEPGLRSLDAKGMRLGAKGLEPGMSLETIDTLWESHAVTPEEKTAIKKWKNLWKKYKELVSGDDEVLEKAFENKFGNKIDKSQMSPEEQADYAITSNQSLYEIMSAYTAGRVKKEGITFKGGEVSRKVNTITTSMKILQKDSNEDSFALFKGLMTGVGETVDATAEEATAKARAFERVFDEINSWDMSEFSFKNQEELLKNAEIKIAKTRMAFELYEMSGQYDTIIKSGKVQDLKYSREDLIKVRARIKAIQRFQSNFSVNYDRIRNPIDGTEAGKPYLTMPFMDIANGLSIRRKNGGTMAEMKYAQTIMKLKQTNASLLGKEDLDALDANEVLEKANLEAEKEIEELRNENK